DAIVMSPASSAGDCAPILISITGELMPMGDTERAKFLSPLMQDFSANAQAHGYDLAVFQAMCILGARVYEIRHRDTGEVRFVNQDDYRVMVLGEKFDEVSASMKGPDTPVGLSLTLASPEQQAQWLLVQQVHDGRTLLTVSEHKAIELNLSRATIGTMESLSR